MCVCANHILHSGRQQLSAQPQQMTLCGSLTDRGRCSKLPQLLVSLGPSWWLCQNLSDMDEWGLNVLQQQPLLNLEDASLFLRYGNKRSWEDSCYGCCLHWWKCRRKWQDHGFAHQRPGQVPCPVGSSTLRRTRWGPSSAVLLWSFTQQSSFLWCRIIEWSGP